MPTKKRLTATQIPGSWNWLAALRTYLVVSAVGHLAWEVVQLPLYTIWSTATLGERAFAVLHCTGGDILIALSALTASLVLIGDSTWPSHGFRGVCVLTVALGIGYTIYSEWLNAGVRGNWTYSDWMPTLPWIGTGVSPLLQWVVIPTLALLALQYRSGPSARLSRSHRTGVPV
jgi:hypothetical protein